MPPPRREEAPGERGGSEERKGIKTIDRELVPGRGIVRSSSSAVLERKREGDIVEEEGGEVWRKERRRNGRSNNTIHKDSAERLVPTTITGW